MTQRRVKEQDTKIQQLITHLTLNMRDSIEIYGNSITKYAKKEHRCNI